MGGIRTISLFVTIIFAVCVCSTAQAETIGVPEDYPTIQDAIDAAQGGDVIHVSPETYPENIDFLGKAITVKGDAGASSATIDGGQMGSAVTFQNGEGLSSVLEGFVITNGLYEFGGGVRCEAASPTIMNNTITGNRGEGGIGAGGGIYCLNGWPVITGNVISDNFARGYSGGGAGIFCQGSPAVISANTITRNVTEDSEGAGIHLDVCAATVTNNIITGNLAYGSPGDGGGIYNFYGGSVIDGNLIAGNESTRGGGVFCYYGSPIITRNRITGNKSILFAGGGGGVHCWNSSPVIAYNQISHNSTEGRDNGGGGIDCYYNSHPLIACNLIAANLGYYRGGGIFCDYDSSPTITNNTIVNNLASSGGGIYCAGFSAPTVTNTILWGNFPDQFLSESSTTTVTCCDIENGWPGVGNIDIDPLFAEYGIGDYHLTFESPCRDAGDDAAAIELDEDFETDPRIVDAAVDMGCDEFYAHLYQHGSVVPGQEISIRVVGTPGTVQTTLAIGSGVLDPPQSTAFGDLYLLAPFKQFKLGAVPSKGIIMVPAIVPATWSLGESYPFQALVGPLVAGSQLTNLMVLTVE